MFLTAAMKQLKKNLRKEGLGLQVKGCGPCQQKAWCQHREANGGAVFTIREQREMCAQFNLSGDTPKDAPKVCSYGDSNSFQVDNQG